MKTNPLKNIQRTVAMGITIVVLCGTTMAESTSSYGMTLNDCTRMALTQNPMLKASNFALIASHEAVGEARAPYYPELGIRGGVSRWQNHAFLPSGFAAPNVSSTIGPTDDWSAGGFARYTLYDGGIRRATLERAKVQESTGTEELGTIRLEVLYDVHRAFYQLASAQELRTVANKSLANAESHLAVASDRQAVGDTTVSSDVLRAQVEADHAKAELIRAETLIHIAKGALNSAMGLPAEQPLEINTGDTTAFNKNTIDINHLVTQAIDTRPEIKAAQNAIESGRYQVQAARSAYRPKVYAEGSYGWRDDSSALDDEAWSIGITVEMSVFDGFSKSHKLAAARAGSARNEALLERVKLAIRGEVWTAFARIQEAGELLRASETQLRHAEESLRMMSARYKVGAVTVTDLLDAQTALTAAEVRHVQARWGCQQAQSDLQHATGTLAETEDHRPAGKSEGINPKLKE